MKKTTLIFPLYCALLLAMCSISFAQQTEKCGTNLMLDKERDKNPIRFDRIRNQVENYTSDFAKSSSLKAVNKVVTRVPTVVHVIHNGEPVGTYPNTLEAQIISGITNLNDAFKNTGPYAGSAFYNSPMEVEFVLAEVRPDGSVTNGIERHDVSSKSYGALYNSDGLMADVSGVSAEDLFGDYGWNPQDYMNIWLVKKIDNVDTGTTGEGILGYASLPQGSDGVTDGLVCQVRAFGYDPNLTQPGFDFGTVPSSSNGTADHEVGHYLNLYHTFEGDNEGANCPADMNVGEDSDGCADTPPHKRTQSICPAYNLTENDCVQPNGGSNEYIHNFMNYSSDTCFQGFSNDQRTRIQAALDGPRAAFKTSLGASESFGSYPAPVQATVTNRDPTLGINAITLNGISFNSLNGYHDGGYLNRVASQPTVILAHSQAYAMTVQVGLGDDGLNNELVDVYIDYNNNAVFEDGERVHQTAGGAGKKSGGIISFTINTPAAGGSIPVNTRLRMRIISGFDNGVNVLASATASDGNIEDYSVSFGAVLSKKSIGLNPTDVLIYPNPAEDFITLKINGHRKLESVSIYDLMGRLIETIDLKDNFNEKNISLKDYASSLYFISIKSEYGVITKRFLKR